MSGDEEHLEWENDRTKLLPENDEHSGEMHPERAKGMEREVLKLSDSEDIDDHELNRTKLQDEDGKRAGSNNNIKTSGNSYLIPKRYIVLILMSLAGFNMYCIRMCLSVTIVAMTKSLTEHSNGTVSFYGTGEFQWDKEFQGTILASLYWGYTATQIPAGLLTYRYGGTLPLGIGIFGAAVLTLATPIVVRLAVNAFLVIRVLEGLFLGMVAASACTIISKWAPLYERSIFSTLIYAGLLLGTVVANSVSGLLAGTSWGWPAVFYFFGVISIIWFIMWVYFVYENPRDHPNISEEELEIIGHHWNCKLSLRDVPWGSIVTSLPVWALIIANITDCWGFYTFMLSFPRYLKDVLEFDIENVGFISSLPYLICVFVSPAWGSLIDMFRRRRYMSTQFARKLSTFIGMGISAIFMIALGHCYTSTTAVVVVTIAISLTAITASGPAVNVVELAPKYSGILMGISNFACNITGFISPEIVGSITANGDPAHQWAIVFYLTATIEIVGMLVYLAFSSGNEQPWADN